MLGLSLSTNIHVDESTVIRASSGCASLGPYVVVELADPADINRVRLFVRSTADLARLENAVSDARRTLTRLQVEATSVPVISEQGQAEAA